MTYHSVHDVTPTGDCWVSTYLPDAAKRVAKLGGTYLARTAQHERVDGAGEMVWLRIIKS